MSNKIIDFQNPFSVSCPQDCLGWESMYPKYLLFSDDNREWEENQFWFHDSVHYPRVQYPFDMVIPEAVRLALSQYNSRIFCIPPSLGVEQRIVNGYLYFSAVSLNDENRIQERVKLFESRSSYYYSNWDDLYSNWVKKVTELINEVTRLDISKLPEIEDEKIIKTAQGTSTGYLLLQAFNKIIDSVFLAWQYHFEFLNLGYSAYLNLNKVCTSCFPSITPLSISKLIRQPKLLLMKPAEEIKRLAELLISYKLEDRFLEALPVREIFDKLTKTDLGRAWLKEYQEVKELWFHINRGTCYYHYDKSWKEDEEFVKEMLVTEIKNIKSQAQNQAQHHAFSAPTPSEILSEYLELISDDKLKDELIESVDLASKVSGYVEDHNFYIEHWFHSLLWEKMRAIGKEVVERGFLSDIEDIFLLNRWEIGELLYEMVATWATCAPAQGSKSWRKIVTHRRSMIQALERHAPLPALGKFNSATEDPLCNMLWGITKETVSEWQQLSSSSSSRNTELQGLGASPGTAIGKVKIIHTSEDLNSLSKDEIVFCETIVPSWGSFIINAGGVVSNSGGIMSHAAVVCRELSLPAVVGTGNATYFFKDGDIVNIDGSSGIVSRVLK
jgi:pyruvate,water dikinase